MFSVIIPLYNKELSIRNTILSVLNQSYQNFEIVIVNDGSTDDSIEVVNNIEDTRIRIIHQSNQGVSIARNNGIKESKYEWIAFLDGDDLWENDHLEEINKMMKIFPTEKVYVTSFEYSDKRLMYKHKRKESIFKIENYFKEAIRENLMWTSIVVVHKGCFDEIGFFNPILIRGEDLDLWSRLAKKYQIVKSLKITALYRVDSENRTDIIKDVEKTHVYYFPLKNCTNKDECDYYKNIILIRLLSYLTRFKLASFLKLLLRYNLLVFFDFMALFFKKINIKIKEIF
ncbi:glycosyltransferase-like protein, family 2 [Acinetobacter radioresistens WC-A-157]|uniref:glycosyltransferase family 2 protein n=1 Tax=Acinetobacter radioresistens TaxID=40216 RepID=UPI000277D83E|nr:glycosyltransferase family A protein [Acinetobacter radioresistens]EJO35931.1 glycosyltransferase-like protein, family 2 [Acinetobacter radioresistens WC-A-157]